MTNVACRNQPPHVSSERNTAARPITLIGPAVIAAAAGIGASDIIAASVVGARFGLTLLWAVLIGAALKALLSEGIARWQLASGTTLLEGVAKHLPRWVLILFAGYLAVWSIGVAAALANGCGLAVENLTGGRVSKSWGAVTHVLLAALIVRSGRLSRFTTAMKVLLVIMFVTIVYCAITVAPAPQVVLGGLLPTVPQHSTPYIFSIIGGIGGSVTLLTYNYLPASARTSARPLTYMRLDIVIAYALTALFAGSIIVIASRVFNGMPAADHEIITRMGEMISAKIGRVGFYLYSLGFWAAVVASLLGTWQTIPFLAAESYAFLRNIPPDEQATVIAPHSRAYMAGLAVLTTAGVTFAFADRPLLLIISFTIIASAIVPFLAGVLLYLNTRVKWSGPIPRNSWFVNVLLLLALVLLLLAGAWEITKTIA